MRGEKDQPELWQIAEIRSLLWKSTSFPSTLTEREKPTPWEVILHLRSMGRLHPVILLLLLNCILYSLCWYHRRLQERRDMMVQSTWDKRQESQIMSGWSRAGRVASRTGESCVQVVHQRGSAEKRRKCPNSMVICLVDSSPKGEMPVFLCHQLVEYNENQTQVTVQ